MNGGVAGHGTVTGGQKVRIGGCKGMLAVWPDDVMRRVAGSSELLMAVRPSMKKFESGRDDLDVRESGPFFHSAPARPSPTLRCIYG